MKKKNLIILLIIPFIISTLTIVTVNVSYNYVDVDISHISWDYDNIEAFRISGDDYKLTADGVNNRNHKVADGNALVWKVQNKDVEDVEPCAEIIFKNNNYYVKPIKDGEVIITCSNVKGNVSRSFNAIMYTTGAAYVTATNPQSSLGKIDQINYYGQFDMLDGNKVNATFGIQVVVVPSGMLDAVSVSANGNLTLNCNLSEASESGNKAQAYGTVTINGIGHNSIDISSTLEGNDITLGNYDFTVVENGVNVYTFNDLMACTNNSKSGEIMVLQTSFVPKSESYADNEKCFGSFRSDGTIDTSFVEYIYTDYNHIFIDEWNESTPADKHLDPKVAVLLHIKKDIYGNGYMINFHNVAFPSQTLNGAPSLGPKDLFTGPLPFYTVGNPKGSIGSDMTNMNLISAYGQDNIGMYVDGDNITINDVVVKNCDDVNSLAFLNTVGTVVEIHGNNIELRNMRMSNGRQVLRSFSSQNLKVNNCTLSHARNFLFITGSNEYSQTKASDLKTLITASATIKDSLKNYLAANADGDKLLIEYLDGTFGTNAGHFASKDSIKNALKTLQNALNDESVKNDFRGSTEICDCSFYHSGISSIALESLFNGPFLFMPDSPTNIAPFFAMFNSMLVGVDFTPSQISGTSYPVKVNISGKTKFYDYKTLDEFDVSGLISESISKLVKEFLGRDDFSIDNIFPIKKLIANKPYKYVDNGEAKFNIPITFYGGGANYSVVTTKGLDDESLKHINGASKENPLIGLSVDLLDEYLALPPIGNSTSSSGFMEGLKVNQNTLVKTVTLVTGYEPFRFAFATNGYLCGQAPSIDEMQKNALNIGG